MDANHITYGCKLLKAVLHVCSCTETRDGGGIGGWYVYNFTSSSSKDKQGNGWIDRDGFLREGGRTRRRASWAKFLPFLFRTQHYLWAVDFEAPSKHMDGWIGWANWAHWVRDRSGCQDRRCINDNTKINGPQPAFMSVHYYSYCTYISRVQDYDKDIIQHLRILSLSCLSPRNDSFPL